MLVDGEIYIEQDGVSCKDVIVNFKGSFMDQVHICYLVCTLCVCVRVRVCVCACVCVILSKKIAFIYIYIYSLYKSV